MYCTKCGMMIDNNSKFCPQCGEQVFNPCPYQYKGSYNLPKKDVGLTLILAIVGGLLMFNGIGQIYVERVGRGFAIMITGWALLAASLFSLVLINDNNVASILIIGMIFVFCEIGLFVWQTYDAYTLAKEYNKKTCETGHPPW
jgi:hypothetical protein